ncbi:hypothetical protein Pmar_PMAR000251 [Perkinsus marinus ATCC 50983]|uniref:Uncharacterized protein n=1 Tax=Perkinsus marinus (strain ATCC 50983 / TXsc) TaxID=423536 RepID=C5LNX9_PERM5|nr:hypothetical protein Pmar_PMAR000251 [Perkinsus marinus ATCC 50983]EER01561.1 hypothetical protein Pmar_PMAR000251 [Perkinsus marinus ATCC 50983]|eukprot:XP_002768843.1 hypothetical protein Pmar_PMAR000251 [Perkinsus marinus ATCC 50983]
MSLSAFITDNRLASPRQGILSLKATRLRRQEDAALRARQKEFFSCDANEVASGIIDAFASAYKSVAKEFSAATKNMQPQPSNTTLNKLKSRTEESSSLLADVVVNALMYVGEDSIINQVEADPARELEELKALEERYGQMLEETAKAELNCRKKKERAEKLRKCIEMERIVVEKLEQIEERMDSLQQHQQETN